MFLHPLASITLTTHINKQFSMRAEHVSQGITQNFVYLTVKAGA